VRNTCWSWKKGARARELAAFDERTYSARCEELDPGQLAVRRAEGEEVRNALEALPAEFREILVMREMEGMSYKEIASSVGIPIGTVMSRLTRARRRLQETLGRAQGEER
jgi:RNA polymerase sigma-70 factor (ECF subfamily)